METMEARKQRDNIFKELKEKLSIFQKQVNTKKKKKRKLFQMTKRGKNLSSRPTIQLLNEVLQAESK